MKFETAVVALDLSPASEAILECMSDLRRWGVKKVILVHVVEVGSIRGARYWREEDCVRWLERHGQRLRETGLETDVRVCDSGAPADEILRIGEQCRADLVVIGSRGHSSVRDLFVGSVAREVIQKSHLSLLMERVEPATEAAEAEGTLCRAVCTDTLRRILLATDFSKEATGSLWYDGRPAADGTYPDGTLVYDEARSDGGVSIGIVVDGTIRSGFATPSRKVELASARLGAMADARGRAVDALPSYVPRDWQPDERYPFYLINWKEASHTHTRTQNDPWLLELEPFAPLIVHPDPAARLGLATRSEVWVESRHGRVRARVDVSRRIHPQVVGLQHGFGHTALGSRARGRGTSDAPLRPTRADPLSGMALHKEACVQIRRLQGGRQVWRRPFGRSLGVRAP